jgi:hypothetical protein
MARRTHYWFVSVDAPKQSRLDYPQARRKTKTFSTEAEAKQFAKQMYSEGRVVLAGTLLSDDQLTRRIVSGWHLRRWIEEP